MPIANDIEFDKQITEMVFETKNKLASMVQDFLIRSYESGQIKKALRPSEINQNVLLATMQFQQHLIELTVSSLAAATRDMEAIFHKRFTN